VYISWSLWSHTPIANAFIFSHREEARNTIRHLLPYTKITHCNQSANFPDKLINSFLQLLPAPGSASFPLLFAYSIDLTSFRISRSPSLIIYIRIWYTVETHGVRLRIPNGNAYTMQETFLLDVHHGDVRPLLDLHRGDAPFWVGPAPRRRTPCVSTGHPFLCRQSKRDLWGGDRLINK